MVTAHDLALAYTRVVCAYWRGDSTALRQFETWLTQFWADCSQKPATNPTAICPHGAAGRGIHWFDTRSTVLGFVPGRRGCYRIPRTAVAPILGPVVTGATVPLAA